MAKEEEKVLENGREQGPDMGMRAVRDLTVCRGRGRERGRERERGRCALGCSWGEGKGEGISRANGSNENQGSDPSRSPSPIVSPVPPRDRARNRIRNHMVTGVQEPKAVSLELRSLLREPLKTRSLPPSPAPALLAARCWQRPCPC